MFTYWLQCIFVRNLLVSSQIKAIFVTAIVHNYNSFKFKSSFAHSKITLADSASWLGPPNNAKQIPFVYSSSSNNS